MCHDQLAYKKNNLCTMISRRVKSLRVLVRVRVRVRVRVGHSMCAHKSRQKFVIKFEILKFVYIQILKLHMYLTFYLSYNFEIEVSTLLHLKS